MKTTNIKTMKTNNLQLFLMTVLAVLFLTTTSYAQETPEDEEVQMSDEAQEAALAKASQKPLAAMYSMPFQNNTTYGIGDGNKSQNVLNIQPVIPVTFEKFNIISRIIFPVLTQPYGNADGSSSTGLADISYTAWFSPSKASKITWGFGPAMQIPGGSSADAFGSREFGIGPSLVALSSTNQWVYGIVVNNVWTFGDIEENKFLFQYFVNYNLPKAWYLVSGPILTANWNITEGEKWTVPFGGGFGKVFKIGKLPVNANAHVYYNAVRPEASGDWGTRFQLQFLFPKK